MRAGAVQAPRGGPAMAMRRGGAAVAGVALGVAAAGLAVALSRLEKRYLVAVVAALAVAVAMLLLGSGRRARQAMTAAMVLGLSIGLSISFLPHQTTAGTYVPFVGGAEGVTLTLCTCACLGYIVADRCDPGRRRWRLCHLLFWPAVLFMAASLPSLLNAIDPALALLEEVRLGLLLLVTLVVMNLTGPELSLYVRVLAASIVLQAGLVAVQAWTGHDLGLTLFGEAELIEARVAHETLLRPTGTLGNPNIAAYFFEIAGPVALAAAFAASGRGERAAAAGAAAAAVAGAALTLSRAAWVALPLAYAGVTVAVFGRRLLRCRILLAGAAALVLLLPLLLAAWPMLAVRLFGDDAGSTGHRIPLAGAAWSVLSQFPAFGAGLNNFALAFERLDLTGYSRVFVGVDHVVHNLHLLVWTEVGTVGFLAYLWYFGAALLGVVRLRRAGAWPRALAFGIAGGLLAHLLHGFVDPGFKLSLTISQLIAAQMGLLGCLLLRGTAAAREASA